jgi:anti-sigma factor RsiW
MHDESLMNVVIGADATDEEDIFLRASLVAALCELYSDRSAAAEPNAQDIVIESQAARTANDGEDDGVSTPVPLARHRAARLRPNHGWAIAASLAAVMILGGGAMGGGKAQSERTGLLDEVAGYHEVYSRETTHLVEVPSSQAEQLTAWLSERLDRDLTVPDLANAGLHFAGGRMLVVNDRPVAELMYTRDAGLPIAICVSHIDGKPWSMDVEEHGELRIASWAKDGYAYLVVGELDTATVRNIAWSVKVQI